MSTVFTGYENLTENDCKILAVVANDEIAESAVEGDKVSIVSDKTPFYAEMGGQIGDSGTIKSGDCLIEIDDCTKYGGNKFIHTGTVKSGKISVGDKAVFAVDKEKRTAIARNHTVTHILQKVLREVLGNHVEQAGSYVSNSRLRFDFTHFEPISKENLVLIEKLVNMHILAAHNVVVKQMSMEEAKKAGAMALFGEKYGDIVRVVDIGGYSIELCGGTHLKNSSQAGSFKLLSESGVAAGVRRIEALTGFGALNFYEEQQFLFMQIRNLLKVSPKDIINKLVSMAEENKKLSKELESIKSKMSGNIADDIINNKLQINGINVMCYYAEKQKIDMNGLRNICDQIKAKVKSGVIVLASADKGKANFVAMATDDVIKKGVKAGDIVKAAAAVCGGSGGGRPNMAQAGGKDISKIKEALKTAEQKIEEQLN